MWRIDPIATPCERSWSFDVTTPTRTSEFVLHEVADPLRDRREAVGAFLHLEEELHRPEDAAREDDVLRRVPRLLPQRREGRGPFAHGQLVASPRREASPTSPRCRAERRHRAPRRGTGSSCRGCSSRRGGSRPCSRRSACRRSVPAPPRRSTGRERDHPACRPSPRDRRRPRRSSTRSRPRARSAGRCRGSPRPAR